MAAAPLSDNQLLPLEKKSKKRKHTEPIPVSNLNQHSQQEELSTSAPSLLGGGKEQAKKKQKNEKGVAVSSTTTNQGPRALMQMWLECENYDNNHKSNKWAEFTKTYPAIMYMLQTRVEANSKFRSSRRHNRLLRCVWKYIHLSDPKQLEEAIQIATPKPRTKKNKSAQSANLPAEEGEIDSDDEEESEDDEE